MNQILSLLERWFNTLDHLGTGFALAGFLFFGGGNVFNFAPLTHLGFASLGAGIIAWGAHGFQNRELSILQRGISLSQRIQEILARAWSLLFIGAGIGLFGYGILALLNPRSPIPASLQQFFFTPQGLVILLLGGSLVGMILALTMIFGSDTRGDAVMRFIKSLPARIFGIVLLLLFITLAALAALQLFAPAVADEWWRAISPF